MPDLNSPAVHTPVYEPKTVDVGSEKAGKYHHLDEPTGANASEHPSSNVNNRYQAVANPEQKTAIDDAMDWDAPSTRGRSRSVFEAPAELPKNPDALDAQRQRSASAPADFAKNSRSIDTPLPPPLPTVPEAPVRARSSAVLRSETSERENNPTLARKYNLDSDIRIKQGQIQNNSHDLENIDDKLMRNEVRLDRNSDSIKDLDSKIAIASGLIDVDAVNTITLDSVMRYQEGREFLRDQTAKEFSGENFAFLNDVRNFENDASNLANDELLVAAKAINDRHVRAGSPQEINVSQPQRDSAASQISKSEESGERLNAKVFSESTLAVTRLVAGDTLTRLKREPVFQEWAHVHPLRDERADLEVVNKALMAEAQALKAAERALLSQNVELGNEVRILQEKSNLALWEVELQSSINDVDKSIDEIDVKLASVDASIDSVLADPPMRAMLVEKAKFGLENINFLDAINDYDRAVDEDPVLAKAKAEDIAKEYVIPNSTQEINVIAAMRNELVSNISVGNIDNGLFAKYRDEVSRLTVRNYLAPLNRDPAFKILHIDAKASLRIQKESLVKARNKYAMDLRAVRLRAVKSELAQ